MITNYVKKIIFCLIILLINSKSQKFCGNFFKFENLFVKAQIVRGNLIYVEPFLTSS